VSGKKVVLATSKAIPLANTVLDYFDIKKYFHFIAWSEMDGTRGEKYEVISSTISFTI
jgi:phosphoglycolate phosphatase-like HAD superfamily hydrolase